MNEEFNSREQNGNGENDLYENHSTEQNAEHSQPAEGYKPESTYHYSYRNENQAAPEMKWQPDSEKYNQNTAAQNSTSAPKNTKKKRSLWWIPVAAGTAVVVAGIVLACVFGSRAIKNVVSNSASGSVTDEIKNAISGDSSSDSNSGSSSLVINEAENVEKSTSTGSVYLTDVSDVVDQVKPAVVSITSRTIVNNYYGNGNNYFNYFFGNQGSSSNESEEVDSGVGSGTIVGKNDKELLILTSYHVVDGCSSLYVTFCDDSAVDGYIKDADEEHDIAIVALRLSDISSDTLSAISMASLSSTQPAVGDGCIVIGDALGYGQSVVTGIISALDRQITVEDRTITVIQTDAAINEGNSGGCLLDANGNIVGISEAKISSSSVEGMCYAISVNAYYDVIMDMLNEDPSDEADQSAADNESESVSSSSQTAYLGIYGRDIGSQLAQSYDIPEGIYVVSTVSGGGAEAAGIQEGDVITAIDNKDVATMTELQSALGNYSAGDKVTLTVMRYTNNSYEEIEVEVTLTAAIG